MLGSSTGLVNFKASREEESLLRNICFKVHFTTRAFYLSELKLGAYTRKPRHGDEREREWLHVKCLCGLLK